MRTSIGICNRKKRYKAQPEATRAAASAAVTLHPYRCDLCRHFHLTGRTKGMFVSRKSDKAAR